jgi:hypothetical protein
VKVAAAIGMPAERRGDWMQTASNLAFWPLDPWPSEVHLYDIAHALSNLCRYGGHCKKFYSVAEHSVHVSRVVPPEHALAGLLHDATEAYCADVPRPLKRFLTGYAEIEQRIWVAIATRFQLPVDLPATVKEADNTVLLAEKEQILGPTPLPWHWAAGLNPADVRIDCWSPHDAKQAFIHRYLELTS